LRARIQPIGVFLLALILRAIYLIEIQGTPLVEQLLIDSATYDRFARLILEGRFHGEEVYSMNVLYPWFLALIHKLARGEGAVPWVQAILDSGSCLMIFHLASRQFDRRVGLWSGIVSALYGPFIFYSGAVLTPTLINFFCLASLLLLVRYVDKPAWAPALLAGLAIGFASLGRGNTVLLVPLSLLFFPVAVRGVRRALSHWVLFAAGAAILLLLVTARNYMVEQEIVPVSANYAAFYIGHNEKSNGLYTLPDFVASADFEGEVGGTRKAVEKALGRPVTVAESAGYLFDRGIEYVMAHPGEEVIRTAKKFYFFWNQTESPTNLSYYFARDFSGLLRFLPISFGWLVPFAALGAFHTRGKWRRHLILYLYMAVYLLTALIFFVSSEYRLPIVPVVIPFAVVGVISIVSIVGGLVRRGAGGRAGGLTQGSAGGSAGTWRALVPAVVILPMLILFCNYRSPLLRAQSLKRVDYLNFGILYKADGEWDQSKRMLMRSVEIDPAFGPAYEALSDLYRLRGEDQEAARYLHLSRQFKLSGQYDRGERRFDDATESMLDVARLYNEENYPEALARFAVLLGQYEEADDRVMVQRLLNNIGLCHYKMGDYTAAEEAFQKVIDENPLYVKAYYNLGKVRERQGRRNEALKLYEKAVAIEPLYEKAWEGIRYLTGP